MLRKGIRLMIGMAVLFGVLAAGACEFPSLPEPPPAPPVQRDPDSLLAPTVECDRCANSLEDCVAQKPGDAEAMAACMSAHRECLVKYCHRTPPPENQ